MSFNAILNLIFQGFALYESDLAVIEAGGTATSPQIQVGTVQGKPLYGQISFSTVKQ